MTRWEYRAIEALTSEALPILQAAGADGWEVCGVEPDPLIAGGVATFWLKRPVGEAVRSGGLAARLAASGYRGGER